MMFFHHEAVYTLGDTPGVLSYGGLSPSVATREADLRDSSMIALHKSRTKTLIIVG